MGRSVPVRLTNMCMVYDGDKILVQDREDPDWGGLAFPGGHVESGESFVESTIREVYEETGLTIESPVLCGVKEWENPDGSRYVVFLFKTDRFSGELVSSEEGKVFWINREDLKRYKLADDFEELLGIFVQDDVSEFFYRIENGKWNMEIR